MQSACVVLLSSVDSRIMQQFPTLSHKRHDFRKRGHHHHKHPGLGHLTRSVSRVTAALSIASSVSQMFSFLVGCRGMISRGFGFVAFFVCVRASSFSIHLSCLVCSLAVVRGEWICLFCSHRRCSLPEVSVA